MTKVLIVDDDKNYVSALASIIKKNGFEVDIASHCKIANEKVATNEHDLVFVDMILPDGNGMDVIHNAPESYPGRFYLMTGYPSVDSAVHALRGRAVDYLIKPVTTRKIDDVLEQYHRQQKSGKHARNQRSSAQKTTNKIVHNNSLMQADEPAFQHVHPEIIGDSVAVRKLRYDINRLATSTTTILLQGETGTGKKLVAQKIHGLREPGGYLHSINCAIISKDQIDAELFGYEPDSNAGGHRQQRGMIEQAAGGTLLLEEITGIPADTQTALLHALESGTYSRVGAPHHTVEMDIRIIVAADSDLIEAVKEGKFREDLYFLLSETPLFVPALRNRGKDILLLAAYFLDHFNQSYGHSKMLDEAGKVLLMRYSWPGNIIELNDAVHRAFLVSDDVLDFSQIAEMAGHVADNDEANSYLGFSIADMEKKLILETLSHFNNDKPRAAEVLGISLKTLYNRLNRYNRPNHEKLGPPQAH